jgi:hypothetical protein
LFVALTGGAGNPGDFRALGSGRAPSGTAIAATPRGASGGHICATKMGNGQQTGPLADLSASGFDQRSVPSSLTVIGMPACTARPVDTRAPNTPLMAIFVAQISPG